MRFHEWDDLIESATFTQFMRPIHHSETGMRILCSIACSLLLTIRPVLGDTDIPATPAGPPPDVSVPAQPAGWSFYFQNTNVLQGVTDFRSPYRGDNSLTPNQTRETVTVTLFAARRLWDGAALVINPEYAQGQGLNLTHGVAGFPNGEATKTGSIPGKLDLERFYVSQVFGFGGDQEDAAAAKNQLAGKRDVSRLTLTLGKMAASDFFDDNSYTHDPRTGFMNWSLWESAGWDYPADAKGYTYGFVAELNQKKWAIRYGLFSVPRVANGLAMESNLVNASAQVIEFEKRFEALGGRPGKLRLLTFANHAHMGSYQDAVNSYRTNPAAGPADITQSRKYRWKYGGAVNLEQELAKDLGAFLRLSLNDGATESWMFTEVDRSAALGVTLKGSRWARSNDTIGLAGAINGLSSIHGQYLAAGGSGILLGDGRLRYAPEQLVELYYDANTPLKFANIMIGYQFVRNPGYNSERGPANIFSVRIHLEYPR